LPAGRQEDRAVVVAFEASSRLEVRSAWHPGGPENLTLTLNLPLALEERLQREAERQGLPADTLTLQLLDQHLPSKTPGGELVELLQSWIEGGDAEEQKETGDYLIRTLDEDRLSDRRLFPPELKGVTW
jgi:hypothetical protein